MQITKKPLTEKELKIAGSINDMFIIEEKLSEYQIIRILAYLINMHKKLKINCKVNTNI